MVKSVNFKHYTGDLEFDYYENQEKKKSTVDIDFFVADKQGDDGEFKSDQFINLYKDFYFLTDNRDAKCPKKVNKQNQSCKLVEDMFFEGDNSIINRSEWTPTDVLNILAWKTGNIDHNNSKEGKMVYKSGWSADEEKDEYEIKLRSYSTSGGKYKEFAKKIADIRKKYIENPVKFDTLWEQLKSAAKEIKGLGTVYLITLVFFITKGECPIYDRYAMAALQVLLVREKGYQISLDDDSIIRNTNLPEKSECKELSKIKKYNNYIGLLYHLFGEEWIDNRDIDRALWVYGHFFQVP